MKDYNILQKQLEALYAVQHDVNGRIESYENARNERFYERVLSSLSDSAFVFPSGKVLCLDSTNVESNVPTIDHARVTVGELWNLYNCTPAFAIFVDTDGYRNLNSL